MQLINKDSASDGMTSIELCKLVNHSRAMYQESLVRLNDFHARVRDELHGYHYENFVVQNQNGTETGAMRLTHEQCMLVAMRESKSVRRRVIELLKDKKPSVSHQVPQSYAEALQLAADQAKQLELAAPKVSFVDNLVTRTGLMTAGQFGQKHGLSAISLNKILDESGLVYSKGTKRGRIFLQSFIDKGLGELKQTEQGYSQALFTSAGEVWINELLIKEGCV